MSSKVEFLRASTPKDKLTLITSTLERLLLEGKRAQVLAPNEASVTFLDDHLWAYKPESFLPHAIANAPSRTPIALTTLLTNFNQADALISLLPTPLPQECAQHFPLIFELLDETSPEKKALSKLKEQAWE